jgi:ATP-dependent Clp protease protease subunit
MSASDAAKPAVQQTLYLTFSGDIDDLTVSRFMGVLSFGVTNGLRTVHLLMQSNGGIIPSGFALHNYLKGLPIDLRIYNGGSVSSIAVVVFLAAKERYASKNAVFMIHKAYSTLSGMNANRLALVSGDTADNDARIEAVLKSHVALVPEKWEIHKYADLTIGADEALESGLLTSIQDFLPPAGCQLVNILNSKA